jgi:hypothetical protein
MTKVKAAVLSSFPVMKNTVYFNNDESTRMSLEQLVLAKPSDSEMWGYLYTSQLSVGDKLMRYDAESDTFSPLELTAVTEEEEDTRLTFAITVDNADLFISGGILTHNK